MNFSGKYVVDTNVPITANLAPKPDFGDTPEDCVAACVDAIAYVIAGDDRLVMDADHEIYEEYWRQLNRHGQPGIGYKFMKWVHDHRFSWHPSNHVSITKTGDSYREFPQHPYLADFDIADRKFLAVANAHAEKPPILQATDSKWWKYRDAFADTGIRVEFLCPEYVRETVKSKM